MRKMDEMEQSIAFQVMRWSWGFGIISLSIYNMYLRSTTGEYHITGLIAAGMFLIQIGGYYYKKQQTSEDKSFSHFMKLLIIFSRYFTWTGVHNRGLIMENNIKELRKNKKISQAKLAELCNVTRQTVNAIENDKYDPTLQLAFDLAKQLETTVDELFTPKKKSK